MAMGWVSAFLMCASSARSCLSNVDCCSSFVSISCTLVDISQVGLHALHLAANVHCDLMNMSKPIAQLIIGIVLKLPMRIQISSDWLELALRTLHPGLYGHKRLFDIFRIVICCSNCCLAGIHGLLQIKIYRTLQNQKEKEPKEQKNLTKTNRTSTSGLIQLI